MQATLSAPGAKKMDFPPLAMLRSERNLIGVHIITALIALTFGIFMGPFQSFHRSPAFVAAFPDIGIPVFSYYYQALTVHGVMNALFFTTFFIVGFTYYVTQRSLERSMKNVAVGWIAYVLMLIGLSIMLATLFAAPQQSAVLYTFYPPLIAPPTFYIGLVLLVVGSWLATANVFFTYRDWRREHPGERAPLAVFAAIANYIMWDIATITVAIEVLFMLLPASLGLITTTDPQLGRVLFWFFGHPLVYFWLIPAYISWYTMLPKQAGGKLFSDNLARVSFLLLMIFSIPVGVHHLFSDPGISATAKGIHTILTFVVAVPSFMTAFNVGASLEYAGRKNGGKGLFGWILKQKWGDPIVAAQLVAMLIFTTGGFSGLINASAQLNIAVHNTSWVPAHFHTTLGTAVTLTYIGILYWLLPMIRGSALFSKKIALAQVYTWGIGMFIFASSMGQAGLDGAPRRADLSTSLYLNEAAKTWLNASAIGGAILLISSILLFVNIVGTLFSKKPVEGSAPISTTGDSTAPLFLERWGVWIGVILILALIAWGPVIVDTLDFTNGFNILRFTTNGSPY
ncbi:MAG: cbb3-type cytochrome c oxidase subunit I [Chloroflexi bacterium]|nr:cbb3-type cytochrome c oxidase subunit I [Chloroflexota bacterium]